MKKNHFVKNRITNNYFLLPVNPKSAFREIDALRYLVSNLILAVREMIYFVGKRSPFLQNFLTIHSLLKCTPCLVASKC